MTENTKLDKTISLATSVKPKHVIAKNHIVLCSIAVALLHHVTAITTKFPTDMVVGIATIHQKPNMIG